MAEETHRDGGISIESANQIPPVIKEVGEQAIENAADSIAKGWITGNPNGVLVKS